MLWHQVRDRECGSVTEGARATWGQRLSRKIDFTVLGIGRPDSEWIVSSVWVYLLVGSMDSTLELPLCATQVQTQRGRRLKEFCVQGANKHKAQWALAWMCTEWYPTSNAAIKIIAKAEWTLIALHFDVLRRAEAE